MLLRRAGNTASHRRVAGVKSLAPISRPSPLSYQGGLSRHYAVLMSCQPWQRRRLDGSYGSIHERRLATAVDDFKIGGSPYQQIAPSPLSLHPSALQPQDFVSFDPNSPLVVPEPEGRRQHTRTSKYGIPGDVDDMLPVFDACLRVGKLDRAALVLKRLDSLGVVSDEERILLHNQYLKAALRQMQTLPDPALAEQLHRFYEMRIHHQRLPNTAETIACMLKASLLSQRGPRLDRLIRRYMGMAPGEAGLRVLSVAEILSDQDLAVITRICPTYNFSEDLALEDDVAELEAQAEKLSVTGPEAEKVSQSEAFPEVQATLQKGQGLETLKRGLQLLREMQDVDLSKLSERELEDIQLQLERDSITSAIERWRHENKNLQKMGINTAVSGSKQEGSLSQYMGIWLEAMEKRIKQEYLLIEESEKREAKSAEDLARCIYGPVLMSAEPSRVAAVTILSVLNLAMVTGVDRGVVVSQALTKTVNLLQEDLEAQKKQKAQKEKRRKRKVTMNGAATDVSPAADVKSSYQPEFRADETLDVESMKYQHRKPWSPQIKLQIGALLIKCLLDSAKMKVTIEHPKTKELVTQHQPAFSHTQSLRKGKKFGVIMMNPSLLDKLTREPVGDFIAKHLPMLSKPKPWKRMGEGGFLDSKTSLVRVKAGEGEQRLYTQAAIKCGDMQQVFKGLDALGRTAWRMNNDVLKVMLEAWNSGEAIANMPARDANLETPPEPDASCDPLVRRQWIKTLKAIENERSGLHSQRCFMNLQMEIARVYRNQTMYFPHNIDYRGRAYPMPTYLNHMGADHTRGLLRFSEGKPLGERGLRWLKIHMANVYGMDKASFTEREAFATDNIANIVESATNPLNGSRWWLKGESPWQCLAACFELKAAYELQDPTQYVSHLPIQQDGTCNGLQHYAALGGDTWGAKQVNLEPGDRPADVYSAVANLVQERIAKEAESENPFAVIMNGKVTRKVVKQTVMTNVYGVTFAGAKKQVCKQIDALYPTIAKDTGVSAMVLSTYVARHTFEALSSMFRGAHDIQYWLGEVGGRVCRALTPAQVQQIGDSYKAEHKVTKRGKRAAHSSQKMFGELAENFRSTVVWTTPLRMPVVQPYRKSSFKEVRTCLQSVLYPVSDSTDPVNLRKQLQGFPPNFIHSLDASHMLLSALKCDELGLNFAAVHDSFWTHAGDVDVMNSVLRDAFINIHEEDVVGRLATEFEARHKGSVYLKHIDPGSPVAEKIRELRTKSKLSPKEELLLEHKRIQLRLSGTPWDLEAARQIITPASIYEDMKATEEDLDIAADAKGLALGTITESEAASVSESNEDVAVGEEAMDADSDIDGEVLSTQADASEAADDSEAMLTSTKMSGFDVALSKVEKPKPQSKRQAPVPIWMPLTIPPIPKKGDFDVTRLRESKYFFS